MLAPSSHRLSLNGINIDNLTVSSLRISEHEANIGSTLSTLSALQAIWLDRDRFDNEKDQRLLIRLWSMR